MGSKLTKVPEKYSGKKIYSISKLQTYEQCQYQFWLNYIQKLKGIENVYGFIGSIAHELVCELQFNRITKEDAIKKLHNDLLEMELRNCKFPSPKIEKNFTECLEHYLNNFQPINCKQIKFEKEIYTEINEHIFRMFIDAVILTNDDKLEIIDFKTSTKYSTNDIEKKYKYQLLLYAYATEQEFKVKLNSVKWNFLKYCTITYEEQLKTKTKLKYKNVARNEIVSELSSDIKKRLLALGKTEAETFIILEKAEKKKEIPEQLKSFYKIEDFYVEYPWNEETKQQLLNYINKIIVEVEFKSQENEFEGFELNDKNSFFCVHLCGQKNNCKYYKNYQDKWDYGKPQDEYAELFG